MDLSKILAITGKGGLFVIIGQTKNGVIVQSIIDGKKFPTYANQQVSALEEISIYGADGDVPLKEIFSRIIKIENGGKTSVTKKDSPEDIKDYFSDVMPEYDEERVYVSDMKKVISWYNLLQEKGVFDEVEKEGSKEESTIEDAEVIEETTEDTSAESAEEEK